LRHVSDQGQLVNITRPQLNTKGRLDGLLRGRSEKISMSALGQKQTFCAAKTMSALPPKAETKDVRFGPKADIVLFDHFIGAGEQRRRHCEAECLRSLKIERKFEVGSLIDRQVGRRCAL